MMKKTGPQITEELVLGEELLKALQFLYGEALKAGLVNLADTLEEAFDECEDALRGRNEDFGYVDGALKEIYILRKFRKLDKEQQSRFIEMIESSDYKAWVH